MYSPSELLKRVGAGGQLLAFFKAVAVYAALGASGGCGWVDSGGEGWRAARAAAKAAPALCLAAAARARRRGCVAGSGQRALCGWVALGLALSALGDALLEWPSAFEPGMAAFAAAQAAYWRAWGPQRRLAARALLCAAAAGYGCWLGAGGALAALVPLYALALALASGRALARGLAPAAAAAPGWPRAAGAAGAALFLASDAMLGYGMFRGPLPHRTLAVMSTYYLAQLGIALTTFEAPPPPPPLPASKACVCQPDCERVE